MRIIEQLVYKIQGDNTEFDKSIDKSETKVSKFGSVADKMLAGVTVAAIGMVIKKAGDMVVAVAGATDRVDKMSQKLGISRTAFQEWDFILSQSGASVDGLQMGIKTLSNAADEAKKGTALYADAFDRLGVSVTDVNGDMKDQETLFAEVFSALADMENQTERTALANKLLGRSATELAPAFNAGGDAIEDMRSKAHELGLVMSDDLIDSGVVLTDNIDKLKRAYQGWKNEALEPLLGLAVTFTDRMLGQDTATKNLETSTFNLAESMQSYKDVTEKLNNPIGKLTESEKALLEIQQQRISLQVNQAIAEVGKNYEDTQRSISNLKREEEGYQKTIDESLAIINSYSEEQREEIDNYQQQTSQITPLLREKKKLKTAQENLEKAQLKLLETQSDLIEENASFESSLLTIANAVINGQVEISTLANINENFAESVRLQVEELQARDKALANARKEFENLKDATDGELKNAEELLRLNGENTYSTELLRLVTEELTKRREAQTQADAEAIKKSEELEAQRQAEADAAVEAFNKETEARKSAYESIEESRMTDKEKAFKTIQEQADAYLKAGVSIADVAKWQSEQIQKYQDEQTRKAQEEADKQKAIEEEKTKKEQEELDKRNQAILEAFNQSTKTRADAYKLLESYSLSERDKAMANIQAQADKFLEAGVSIVDVATWQKNELGKLQEQQAAKAEEEAERVKQAWLGYFDIMSGVLNTISSAIEDFSGDTISDMGKTTQAIGQATGDVTTQVVGAVVSAVGEVISFFDDMAERGEIWAQNMQNLSYEVMQTQLANTKATLDQEYQMQKDALDEQENLRITALLNTLSEEEQAELKAQGFIEETKMERLARELKEAEEAGDAERANVLENAIQIQSIRDEVTQQREEAEREYRQKVAQYDYDKAELDKKIAIANAKIAMNKAIADLGWFNRKKKDEVRGLYGGLISEIQATPLPPLPSYDVGSIRIPETTTATVHKDEMILTAPQAEQARQEGITIAPTNRTSGTVPFVVQLDGREIARAMLDNINTGSIGTIKARVVK